jgi:hypothetical protein
MATVTGTLQNALGDMIEGQVTVQLCGYGAMVPRANGTGLFGSVSTLPADVPVSAAGLFTFEVTGNDAISPVGTYYTVTVSDANGDIVQVNAYQFLGQQSYDLNLIDPFDPTQPIPPLPPLITNLLMLVPFSPTPVFPGDTYTTWAITLSAEVTSSTLTGQVAGNLYTFIIAQNSTGGYLFAWPAAVINESSINPMPNSLTIQTFVCIANNGPLMAIGPATWWRP